jgi:hypothetical protein
MKIHRFLILFTALLMALCLPGALRAQDDAAPANLLPQNDNTALPHMGIFEGNPNGHGIDWVDDYAKMLHRTLMWGHCSQGWDGWGGVDASDWLFRPWSPWVAAMPGRRLVISVPMLVYAKKGMPPFTLAEGAKGTYNDHFTKCAQNLVQYGLGNSIIRLGWEWDGGWYPWRVMTPEDAANFKLCWQQIVKTMRAVPGAEKLEFCWNGAGETKKFELEDAYPGDDVVDYVGLDIYDKTWAPGTYPYPDGATDDQKLEIQKKVWQVLYNGKFGIKAWVDIAKAHHKGFMIPEWGIGELKNKHGGGDDPYFVQQMYNLIQDPANNVYEAAYWDGREFKMVPTGLQASPYPKSWDLFQKLFSLPPGTPTATGLTAPPPTPEASLASLSPEERAKVTSAPPASASPATPAPPVVANPPSMNNQPGAPASTNAPAAPAPAQ